MPFIIVCTLNYMFLTRLATYKIKRKHKNEHGSGIVEVTEQMITNDIREWDKEELKSRLKLV